MTNPPSTSIAATVFNVSEREVRDNQYDTFRSLPAGDTGGFTPLIGELEGGPDVYGVLSKIDADDVVDTLGVNPLPQHAAMVVKMAAGPPPYDYSVPGYHWVFFVNLTASNLNSPMFQYGDNFDSGLNTEGTEKDLRASGRAYNPLAGTATAFANRPVTGVLGPKEVFATLMPDTEPWF